MIREAIQKVIERRDLTGEEAFCTMESIMCGEATPAQIGAFLIAMRMKGELPHGFAGGCGSGDSGCQAWEPFGFQ
jgi:anthranilate phosphoribosyltransferase